MRESDRERELRLRLERFVTRRTGADVPLRDLLVRAEEALLLHPSVELSTIRALGRSIATVRQSTQLVGMAYNGHRMYAEAEAFASALEILSRGDA